MPRNTRGLAVHGSRQENRDIDYEDGLGGRLRRLSINQNHFIEFAMRNTNETACTIMLSLSIMFPISMAAMGLLYLHECPGAKHIPIYLLVAGCFFSLYIGGRYFEAANKMGYYTLLSMFLTCWFITGAVWIFSAYEPSYDINSPRYCNKYLYRYSFWVTIIESVLSFIMLIYLCKLCHLPAPVE